MRSVEALERILYEIYLSENLLCKVCIVLLELVSSFVIIFSCVNSCIVSRCQCQANKSCACLLHFADITYSETGDSILRAAAVVLTLESTLFNRFSMTQLIAIFGFFGLCRLRVS